jgi:hypothetical protein
MDNLFDNYILLNLSDDERLELIENYEQFERDGVIGDVPLRMHAEKIQAAMGQSMGGVVRVMGELRVAVLKRFAEHTIQALKSVR